MDQVIYAYCTNLDVPAPDFEHELHAHFDRSDPSLPGGLQEACNYAMHLSNGQMTNVTFDVIMHLRRVQHYFCFSVNMSDAEAWSAWGWQANAIFLFGPNFCDPSLWQILPVSTEELGTIPFQEDALRRKERTMAELAPLGIRVPDVLPPVISEYEVDLRDSSEVAKRLLALFVVALKAESLATNEPIPSEALLEDFSVVSGAFTENEMTFLSSPDPAQDDVASFGWRYESVFLLEWVLGLVDELPFPNAICDVPLTAKLALENNSSEFIENADLRPVSEILDALDQHYRLHWAVRENRKTDVGLSEVVEPGVVYERHYALNWLVRFGYANWDDVDTPT